MKNIFLFVVMGFFLFNSSLYGQNLPCQTAQQVCFETGDVSYLAGVGDPPGQYMEVGCLNSIPNQKWFYLKVGEPGRINIHMWTSPPRDLDFVAWGPFTINSFETLLESDSCAQLNKKCMPVCGNFCLNHPASVGANPSDLGGYPCGNVIDCSFSPHIDEYIHLPDAVSGDFYVLLITNYSNQHTQISFNIDSTSVGSISCLMQSQFIGDTVCIGGTANLTLLIPPSGANFTFQGPNGFYQSSTSPFVTINNFQIENAGIYSLIITPLGGSPQPPITAALVVSLLPGVAQAIEGESFLCQGEINSVTYTVPNIPNATSYMWTLPAGAIGSSDTNSIAVDFGTSAISGDITVKGINSFGNGSVSTLPITVSPIPQTPIISSNGSVLYSNAPFGNQWYNQNGIILGATDQNYTPVVDGDYYVVVTLLNCSSNPSNVINITVSGIDLKESDRAFKVYPNPVSNELIIEFVGNKNKMNFDIINSIGQVVFKGNLVDKTIVQTSNFTSGIYMIKLENGDAFEFVKIIKD